MKVLVVKCDLYTQRIFQLILSREGYTVLFSPTCEEGLLAAKEVIPNFILLDIVFPDSDSVHFLHELRAAPETESIPVIIFIESSQAEKKIKYVHAGASVCLVKPIRPHLLIAQIEALHL